MKSLRGVSAAIEPALSVMSVQAVAQAIGVRPESLRPVLLEGTKYRRVVAAPLVIVQHNMGLMVFPAPYKGTDRDGAVASLITHLKAANPDIVGLSECWADGEKDDIASALSDLCPHRLEGPDEADLESDGGLLLLSRHPFIESGSVIYRDCEGADCYANKGAIWGRIAPPGHPCGYDIFLSHTQNPDAASDAPDALDKQLDVLATFVAAKREPAQPSILMGDLNTDGRKSALYEAFAARLGFSTDVWLQLHASEPGITFDNRGSFDDENPALPVGSPERHKDGQRLDYLLVWDGITFVSSFDDIRVVLWQSAAGRDISDHYGMQARQARTFEFESA